MADADDSNLSGPEMGNSTSSQDSNTTVSVPVFDIHLPKFQINYILNDKWREN